MKEFRHASELEPYIPQTREERIRIIFETIKAHPEGLHLRTLIGKIVYKWGLRESTVIDYFQTLERAGLIYIYDFKVFPKKK